MLEMRMTVETMWKQCGTSDQRLTNHSTSQNSSLILQASEQILITLTWPFEPNTTFAVVQVFPNFSGRDPQNKHIWSGDPTIFDRFYSTDK